MTVEQKLSYLVACVKRWKEVKPTPEQIDAVLDRLKIDKKPEQND